MEEYGYVSCDQTLAGCIRTIRLVAFDFDGVFTDNSVYVSQDGTETVRCWRGDGLGLRQLDRLGLASLILSSEPNPVVTIRAQKLKIRVIQGCEEKRATLERLIREMDLTTAQVAFVGNDINDLPCLKLVGLPIVVQDAHPVVIPYARYQTRACGGYGAVREVCDLFYDILSEKKTQ
jgi:YrbI family 3-deoxy-D-manno-octulosonate 8-phosphate phosphatase